MGIRELVKTAETTHSDLFATRNAASAGIVPWLRTHDASVSPASRSTRNVIVAFASKIETFAI